MKKITMRRRMLSLTLAASVALPQASSAFAASLWNENGENDHITQVIESSQPEPRESAMPWVTLPADDKPSQTPAATPAVEVTNTPIPTETVSGEKENDVPPSADVTTKPSPALEATPAPSPAATPADGSALDPDRALDDVTMPVATPEVPPAATPEATPDQGDVTPSDGELSDDLTTAETAGPEQVAPGESPAADSTVMDVDSTSVPVLYAAPEGVALSQWMYYRLGYGVKVEASQEGDTVYPTRKLLDLGGHFFAESKECEENDSLNRRYGYRDYAEYRSSLYGPNPDPSEEDYFTEDEWHDRVPADEVREWDNYSVMVFPSADALGRVPDQQFTGWYVYPSGAKAGLSHGSQAVNWQYGESYSAPGEMTEVVTMLYEEGDPYYSESYSGGALGNTFGALGATWDGGCDYGYGHFVERDEDGRVRIAYYDWEAIPGLRAKPVFGDAETNPVSFVGKWEPSDESRADSIVLKATVDGQEITLPLYTQDMTGKNEETLTSAAFSTGENGGAQEYWLRVPAGVDKLSLDLSTLELYYNDYAYDAEHPDDYAGYTLDTARSHVQVTVAFGGVTTSYTGGLSAQMLPAWTVDQYGRTVPHNSTAPDERAHSEWSVSDISLSHALAGSLYNDIVVTVTSPSGDVTTTYTFHVQRLTDPTLTRTWGNTPAGMLYRDAASGGVIGSASGSVSVASALEYFEANRQFNAGQGTYPNGSANQNGTIFRDPYTVYAWPGETDVDLDPTAIIVYQDSVFQDPGISLTDTEGKAVDISRGNVYRSLKLKQVDALSTAQIGKTVGTDCWYKNGSLLSKNELISDETSAFSIDFTFEQISEQNGTNSIDLKGKNVLPGIYIIEYRYIDPVSGQTYSSDSSAYVTDAGKAGASAFRRTLVVLPTPGDVDMDGAVTMADALALQDLLGTTAGHTTLNGEIIRTDRTEADPSIKTNDLASLFAYRVCDINHDGVLDKADVELLRTLPNPKTVNEINASNSDYFYIALPTGESGDRYVRKNFTTATGDGPKVEMVYLGKEGGTRQESGHTSQPTGPWDAIPATSDDGTRSGVEIGDTFWLGVKLVDKGKIDLEAVRSLTFTLVYDSRYLEPAVVLNESDWGSLITGTETEQEQFRKRWEGMMRLYNLDSEASRGDGGTSMTVWTPERNSESGYSFTTAAGTGKRFTTHYSTAKIPLESVLGETATERDRLQTITFSVELQDYQVPIILQSVDGEGYLFAVPFRMLRHPFGMETAQLVEFEADMRGFTLVGNGNDGTTFVYSSQNTVFGGTTLNLAEKLPYSNVGAQIPLGEDRTEVYQIYNFNHDGQIGDSNSTTNAVYASDFLSRGGRTASGTYQGFALNATVTGNFPEGLTYHPESRQIDGIPERAGTYEFYIGNIPYRLVVDKADLRFWADNKSSYYGQPEFRCEASSDFTFSYAIDDICKFERERAQASGGSILVDGKGSGLAALLNDSDYNANQPTFTAVDENDVAVNNATPVRNAAYQIVNRLLPISTNYNFIYSPTEAGTNAGLRITPRPIQVVRINGTPEDKTVVGDVFSDQPGTLSNRKAMQGTDVPTGSHTFTVRLASTDGSYNGLPLTQNENYINGVILPGDLLEITFGVDYIRNQTDIERLPGSNLFYLSSLEEYRDVTVRDIQLTGGVRNENYRLVSNNGAPDEPVVADSVVGRVLLRQTRALRISQLPILTYQYGNRFTQSNEFHFFILKDGDIREGEYRYSDSEIARLGVEAYWATAEEREAHLRGDPDYPYGVDRIDVKSDQMFTMEYNGRYLCLSARSVNDDDQSVVIRCYADEPLVVTKRLITLTATPGHRYYGEENGELHFTYDPAELAAIDWTAGLTGAGEELLTILAQDDYKAPQLKAVVADPGSFENLENAVELTTETDYTGSANRVIIWDASSRNYQFLYRYTDGEGSVTNRNDYGVSTYQIEQRPIVVERIVKGENEPLVKLYADTHRIATDNVALSMDEVALDLPEHTATTSSYYRRQTSSAWRQDIGFAEGAAAVVNNDEISFTYTATVVPTDGVDYMKYIDFSHGYFNLSNAENGYRDYPVQVSNLRLAGADAGNYILVYKSSDKSVLETTNRSETVSGIYPGESPSYNYYAAMTETGRAIGRVYLRPIEDIEILTTGRMNYTYGETYDPTQGDSGQNSRALSIRIRYVNDETINNYEGNPVEGVVTFRASGVQNGQVVTTFDDRTLKIYYVKDGQTAEDVVKNHPEQELGLREALYVNEHTGAKLVVTGRRGEQAEPVISQLTTGTLQVGRKTLTLTAEAQHRVYGEPNPDLFTFTFPSGDLAQWDREKLGVDSAFETLAGARLSELGYDYAQPVFGTEATQGSDVLDGGRRGYDIVKVSDGELDNYTLQYASGTLHIYPRPVRIRRFISSSENPIYTVFSDVGDGTFFTNVDQSRFELDISSEGGYRLGNGTVLPAKGDGLYSGDAMVLRIQVDFPDLNLGSGESQGDINGTVQNATLVPGTRAASNYVLETRGVSGDEVAVIDQVGAQVIGRVELRNVAKIEIIAYPENMTYTYGESLDLSGLMVKITYYTGSDMSGNGQTTNVPYIGAEQFAEQGLYVNYYDAPTRNPDDDPATIKDEFRAAATGDHLTIAPTHDSQLKGRRDLFSANGKYLVITAQVHKDLTPTAEIIPVPITVNPLPITFDLSAEDKIYNGDTQAAGTITFTNIFNQSGIVDTMNTNGVTDLVYPVTGADYESPWTSYAGPSRERAFQNFNTYVAQNGYSFTTGRYVANDPSILTENKTLRWTSGYHYDADGVMRFSYQDPNVAYAQATGHDFYGELAPKEVQVTGLRLAGPDAANYTLVGQQFGDEAAGSASPVEVTTNNVTTIKEYQGTGLPTATIHKANRASITDTLLPQVEIDPHTNVVRIVYDQELSAIQGGEEGAYQDELHFEFALQQVVTVDETTQEPQPDPGEPDGGAEEGTETVSEENGVTVTDVLQWAGDRGEDIWADPRYFGGEAAPMTAMEITTEDPEAGEYVPREEDIPKEDSITETTAIKGQVYQWNELDNGFTLDLSAYPGGVLWPGYELYTTQRTALARDAVYLAVIRAAETHNYNASPALSSVEGYTPAMIQAILDARKELGEAVTGAAHEEARRKLDSAVQAAAEPLERAVLEARADAQAEVDVLMEAGESNDQLEERPVREAAPSVKTYKQVIETVSLKELQGEGTDSGAEPYQVPTLEAIWFTDLEEIPSKEVLDAAVWNTDPVRYRTYAWDRDFTAELTFGDEEEPISLRGAFEVEVTDRREDGGEETESRILVNEDHNARLYVDTTFPSSGNNIKVERIVLRPGSIMAVLGDRPVELGVTLYPARARASKILWTSSDPSVAVVSDQGMVSFLGVGTAVITATVPGSYPGAEPLCSASITVTVVENWKEEYPNSIFDFGNVDAFLVLTGSDGDGDKLFMPEEYITRGETARLLAQFYVANPTWGKTGPEDFADLTGEEDYAAEARLLGSLGVFMGYPEGDFGGEQYISRAEFVTLLARMTGLNIVDTAGQTHAFLDTGEEDTWAYSEIDALSRQPGVLLGVGEGYFAPGRSITRSEVAALLTRLLKFPLEQNGELVVPVDVAEDHWAWDCILRAVNGSQILEESLLEEIP